MKARDNSSVTGVIQISFWPHLWNVIFTLSIHLGGWTFCINWLLFLKQCSKFIFLKINDRKEKFCLKLVKTGMRGCYLKALSVFQDSKPTTLSHGCWSSKEVNSYPLNTTHPWICSFCSPWLKCSFLTPKLPRVVKESQDYNLLLLLFHHPAMSNSVTPWTIAHQASLSLTISQCLPKFMSIASVMPSSHLILWYRLLPP